MEANDKRPASSSAGPSNGKKPKKAAPTGINAKVPRPWTLTLAVPGSIAAHPSRELRTSLCGQVARTCVLFGVDEVVVWDDKGGNYKGPSGEPLKWDPCVFMARILQYCETPPCLRRALIPQHSDLQSAGVLPPLEAPHHVRQLDRCPFREGVTIDKPPGTRPGADQSTGSFVDVGCKKEVLIDKPLKPGVRVTVRMEGGYDPQGRKFLLGRAAPPETPRQELGSYWGYELRLAGGLQTVFADCPYEGGYDYKIGTSDKAKLRVDDRKFKVPPFKHLLVVCGGSDGLEDSVENDEALGMAGNDASKLFNAFVRTTPKGCGSRTVRAEENVMVSLSRLASLIDAANPVA